MGGGIDDTVQLDYIEFQILPSQNRYESYVGQGRNTEMVTSATLEPLLLHLPAIKELHAKGFDAKYKLIAPVASNGGRWFTKSTLVRFLHLVGLPEVVKVTNATKNEISQLEEARKFHVSLYAGNSSNGDASNLKAGMNSTSSDDSKNELLRAIDLRLTALRGELAAAFAEAAATTCSIEQLENLEKFSHHFGASDLRDSLCKLVELNQEKLRASFNSPNLATNGSGKTTICRSQETTNQKFKHPQTEVPVKYNASPAKAAEAERESSSDCEESSCSSEEEQPSVERSSRTMIRSASPRRSASPMRRVQIGRSGSRRSTALTIKSLNYISRDRLVSQKDAAAQSSDEESSEQPSKRSDSNVKRMSVQDAISLFESKQRDQTVDSQKTKSSASTAVVANKSVLRRWSAGAGERFSQGSQSIVYENSVSLPSYNLEDSDLNNGSSEAKLEDNLLSEVDQVLPTEAEIRSDSFDQRVSSPYSFQENAAPSQTAETSEKLIDSVEWSRQKEAELNQLLLKMIETKPAKYQNREPDNRKRQSLPSEPKGGFYDHYKEKRNEKLRQETNGKREEKEKQLRAMQQVLDQRKAEMPSAKRSEAGRKRNVKAQKPQKTSLQSSNQKQEITKPAVVKKVALKASSPLPATRKSWPSTPSPRPSSGISPAKTPPGVTSTATPPMRKKPQPATSVPQSSPKVERPQPKPKSIKSTQIDTKKSVKEGNEKKQQSLKKPTKPTKPKSQSVSLDSASSTKPSLNGKVTKKSSVVPVESKPFLRKGSGTGSVGSVSRTKVPSEPEEVLINTGDLKQAEENEMVSSSSDHAIEPEMNFESFKDQVDTESNSLSIQQKDELVGNSDEVTFPRDCFLSGPTSNAKDAEESMISPTVWVEIEEHEEQAGECSTNVHQDESQHTATPVGLPSPRVRHSLSQMLLEESSEPDVIEWGNAENPPALVYQKDVPKGLKRLLKFARKSKTDANSTGWSSPSVFSEGEDDTDDSRVATKRSTENLLKKATLHAKNLGHQKASTHDKNPAAHGTHDQVNLSKSTTHGLSETSQEGQISAPVNTTKATRSFFSLSAFKGGKQNEGKFR